jgi:alkanesulfonate monooxygenase SsuD/methylene tetrahydromethanopterin reductase-like flavin-dependent oxidoreductase (luciferase family)
MNEWHEHCGSGLMVLPRQRVQFGVFLPIANGGWITSSHAPRSDGQPNTLVLRAREGFMTAVVCGSAATLRRQLAETIHAAELDGLMLVFPDFIEDQKFFGEQVLPDLRRDLVR